MTIGLIISIVILLIISLYLFINSKKKCEIKDEEIAKLKEERQKYTDEANDTEAVLDFLKKKQAAANQEYEEKIAELKFNYEETRASISDSICALEDKQRALKEELFQKQNKLEEVEKEITASVIAVTREREKEEQLDFYKLSLNDNDAEDVRILFSIRPSFRNPNAISKLIWSEFFLKQTTDLCNRIFSPDNKICGIYKITNINSKQCYIGQSKDCAARIKQHVKCGLGIDTPSSNALYKAMLKDGVWNFTFELLEECSPDKLNERERSYIEVYKSKEYGYNTTLGVNK